MRIITLLCLIFLVGCKSEKENKNQNIDLYRQSVSELSMFNTIAHYELEELYIKNLTSKSKLNCVDSLVLQVHKQMRPMYENIVLSGGGVSVNNNYLLGDTSYDIAKQVIVKEGYIKEIRLYCKAFSQLQCDLTKEQKILIQDITKVFDFLEDTFTLAVEGKIVLGQLYYRLLVFESKYLLNAIQLSQLEV